MKIRTRILVAVLVVSFAAVGMAQVETEKLADSIGRLKSYTYGNTNGVDLGWVEKQVGMASADASARRQVEQKLIDTLAAATTNDARQFLCRQLRTVGTAKAVPQLESMLTNPEISHMARYALGRIDAYQAGEALHRALKKTSGRVKSGIINTLAQIGYGKALADYMKHVGDPDKDVAIAAIRATGRFPCSSSIIALQRARRSAGKDIQIEIDAALLVSAEVFLAKGDKKRAGAIYQEFYSGKYSGQLRTAGLRGLAATQGEGAADLLVEAIKGNDADLRRNAIGMMALIKGKKTTDTFVKLSKSLPADGQELIVRSLAARGDASASSAIIDMTASEHENVRLASLEALGGIGTPQAVGALAKAAATAGDREKQIARASLVRIKGKGIKQALIKAVNSGEAGCRVEVIRAIGQRNSRDPFPALHRVARTDADASVRNEAILSMGRVGKAGDLDTLLKLAIAPKESGDRPSIERAIAIVFNKIGDSNAQADPVIAALKRAPDEAKPVLLNLLTRPATTRALEAVRAAVKSADKQVSDAAIRALGEWPNADPAAELYTIAASSSNEVHRVLALRSFIRMAILSEDPTAEYVKALKLAKRPEDIKAVLGGLGNTDTLTALEIAEKYMGQPAYRAEACHAAVRVARNYCWQDRPRTKALLEKIIADAPNESIRNDARGAIENMEKWKDYIFVWKGAGPYVIKGVNDGPKVFEKAFEPEKDADSKNIRWVTIRGEMEGDRINLQRTFGDLDYCCAYAVTTIVSPKAQEAKIHWSVDDYIKGWINGTPTGGGNIKLKAGANTFMLKIGDHGGGWNFNCKLTKPDDSPLEGLRFERR